LVQNAASSGNYLLSAMEVIEQEYEFVSNVRGRGLFCAVDLLHSDQVQSVIQEAYSEGLLILPCGEKSIRFRPMLQIQENHIEEMIKILKRVLDKQK
jgi:L-lysine 6-transaminase